MNAAIRTIDLFAGAGGLTAGFHKASARYQPTVAVEFDHAAAATYQSNHPTTTVVNEPIQDWLASNNVPAADVIVGGPPCQGFSTLGNQNADDSRNALWRQYAAAIVLASPKYFVVENVAKFLDSPQFAEFHESTLGGGVLRDYNLRFGILNAAHYGAAQTRRRALLIGSRKDVTVAELPTPTHVERSTWMTVAAAWRGVEPHVTQIGLPEREIDFGGIFVRGAFKTSELHLTRHYTSTSVARFRCIPAGGNRFHLPTQLQAPCWRKHTSGSGDVMGRLWADKPSVTIRTEFFKPEKGRYLHPTENRAITHLEAARIQGFDDDYLWCGSKTEIGKQIGNAVPIPLGAAVGRVIANLL